MSRPLTNAERFATLETEFRLHREQSTNDMAELKAVVKAQNEKIEQLLSLKAKGQGAFWLATSIFGTSFAVFISYVIAWFK